MDTIKTAIDDFQELIDEVASDHSYATIRYDVYTNEAYKVLKEFNALEDTWDSDFSDEIDFDNVFFIFKDTSEWLIELGDNLNGLFQFNLDYSFKDAEGKAIASKVNASIMEIVGLILTNLTDIRKVEEAFVDNGGYDIRRIQVEESQQIHIFELIRFID